MDRLEIHCIQCPGCQDIVFSRARHDMRYCTCGASSMDGGFEYARVGWKDEVGMPTNVTIHLSVTRQQLYDDWNYRENKFGIIPLAK